MASLNLSWIGGNWFCQPNKPSKPPNFAYIGGKNVPIEKSENHQNPKLTSSSTNGTPNTDASKEDKPGMYSQMLEQFYWECEHRPDHRHTPEVERILSDDPFLRG